MLTYGEFVTSTLNQQPVNAPSREAVVKLITWVLQHDWADYDLSACEEWLSLQLHSLRSASAEDKACRRVYQQLLDGITSDHRECEFVEQDLSCSFTGNEPTTHATSQPKPVLNYKFQSKRLLRHRIRANRAARAAAHICVRDAKPMF